MYSLKEKSKKVNFCLTETTQKQVRELALKWDRSISSTLRILIDRAYQGEGQYGNA